MQHFAFFSFFSCPYQKNVVYLRSQFHAGDVCASSAGVADIFKRRLLALCSDYQKSRKFQLCSGLSNGRCPTGYRLSLLCLLVRLLHIHICAHAYLNYVAREYILYSAWASRCRSNTMGNARASGSGTAIVGLHAFFMCLND